MPAWVVGGFWSSLVLAFATGQDPLQLLQLFESSPLVVPGGPLEGPASTGSPGDELGRFASVVLADTEETWGEVFTRADSRNRPPILVLFSGAVQSACGFSRAAVGGFYCPADERV